MTVLLDTDLLPENERVDALQAAYDGEQPARTVRVEARPVRHRVERLVLGPDVQLLRTGGSALHIVRTARQVRADAPEHIAIGLHRRGRSTVCTADGEFDLPVGQLNCVDMTRPYELVHHNTNDHDVLILNSRTAEMSVDLVRSAAPALARSPVYALVRQHFAGLYGAAGDLSAGHRLLTGQATIALVRALLTTAAQAPTAADAMMDALEARILLHIDAGIGNQDLSVATVAAAHHISVRHLYNVWARAGHDQPPAEWILQRRLQRARQQLIAEGPAQSIAAVARQCGFADSSHFSRRFRAAFGMSPREWRLAGAACTAADGDRDRDGDGDGGAVRRSEAARA